MSSGMDQSGLPEPRVARCVDDLICGIKALGPAIGAMRKERSAWSEYLARVKAQLRRRTQRGHELLQQDSGGEGAA